MMKRPGLEYQSQGAIFDEPHRRYRYHLHRLWTCDSRGTVLWILLNPSTADAQVLDPTLRRCQQYTRAWGYGGFEVCNLFALRSTDPDALMLAADPVGPLNDRTIHDAVTRNALLVCAWGTHRVLKRCPRDHDLCQLLCEWRTEGLVRCPISCLALTHDGHPRHPLYLRGALQPQCFTLSDAG